MYSEKIRRAIFFPGLISILSDGGGGGGSVKKKEKKRRIVHIRKYLVSYMYTVLVFLCIVCDGVPVHSVAITPAEE